MAWFRTFQSHLSADAAQAPLAFKLYLRFIPVCRMNPDVAHGQMLPVEENPFHLEPVLRRCMYPFQVWQTLVDKDILRTFIVPPYIKDEVRPKPPVLELQTCHDPSAKA